MTVRLTKEKKESLKASCQQLLQGEQFPIRQVARTIGKIVASFPRVLHGPLYYRNLEPDKIAALKYHKGNFDGIMQLSSAAKAQLQGGSKTLTGHTSLFHMANTISLLLQMPLT